MRKMRRKEMKAAIIVDSVGYSKDFEANPDIYSIALSVNFSDGRNMKDSNDDSVLTQFYQQLPNEKQLPTTSQPTVGDYYALMDQLVEKGYEVVYCIHLAAAISGTYQSAVMVTNEYEGKIKSFCIDSKGASVTMEGIVRAALELFEQDLTPEAVAERLTWLANANRVYLMVEDLSNLAKGGRLSTTSAVLGGILQIRPLLYFDQEGKIVLFEKIRTNKKVYKRWSELVGESLKQYPKGIEIAFAHADAYDEVKSVEKEILAEYPHIISYISPLSPVVGAHTGRGAKGFAIIPKIENYPQ